MAILVVAAHDNKAVRANVANAVAAAGQMGSDVTVLVAGSNCGDAAKSAAARRVRLMPRAIRND